jgi:hypothetical protein
MTDERRNDLLVRLLDALERYYRHLSADDCVGRRAFDEISAWFASTDREDANAFERIAVTLDLDPAQIRRSLERRRTEIRGPRVGPCNNK